MDGRETELDKTILEAVRDPLTHLVRNCIDHGIESPADRAAAGKPAEGTLVLRAFHEGGQVSIEITDDGAGIDPARLRDKAVSEGPDDPRGRRPPHRPRGHRPHLHAGLLHRVRADQRLRAAASGWTSSRPTSSASAAPSTCPASPGRGTTVRIRIPLTLAIIPALVVTAAANRYAIPQVNLLELVRLDATQAAAAIENVHGAPVYRLRGRLLPLVDLREQLGLDAVERETTYIVVLQADNQQFGLVVDDILDTEEIVVKPLGNQLRAPAALRRRHDHGRRRRGADPRRHRDRPQGRHGAGVRAERGAGRSAPRTRRRRGIACSSSSSADGRRAGIPRRRGRPPRGDRRSTVVERAGHHEVVQYREQILPLVRLDHVLHGDAGYGGDGPLQVVVCRKGEQRAGVVVAGILDIVETDARPSAPRLDSSGGDGSAVIAGHVTELVDIDQVFAGLPGRDRLARTA